ncbi:uncharacterized protein [Miscanthus floridulus]|uniref:uncharacterized protein n=1 Tax=Miscanthus floridulus TaxID=154761 RepID=UPI003457A464
MLRFPVDDITAPFTSCECSDSAVTHLSATLTLERTRARFGWRKRDSGRPHSVSFDLNGYYYNSTATSSSTAELCMVGSGSYAREDGFGAVVLSNVVLRLHLPQPSNLSRPFVTGSVEGAGFDPIALLAYAEDDYAYGEAASCPPPPVAVRQVLRAAAGYYYSCPQLRALLRSSYSLEYMPNEHDGTSSSSFPLRLRHGSMYVNQMRCAADGAVRAYMVFYANQSDASSSSNYTAVGRRTFVIGDEALVADGFWDPSRSQLCLRACRVASSGQSRTDLQVRECGIGVRFWFPAVWSIRDRSIAAGMIWNTSGNTASGVILVSRTGSYRGNLSGISYNYTRVEEAKKHYDSIPALSKERKGRLPGNYSYRDFTFRLFLEKQGLHGYAWPVTIGSAMVEGDEMMADTAFSLHGAAEANKQRLLNVSYNLEYQVASGNLSANVSPLKMSPQLQRVSAEGVYDTRTGSLCLVACRLATVPASWPRHGATASHPCRAGTTSTAAQHAHAGPGVFVAAVVPASPALLAGATSSSLLQSRLLSLALPASRSWLLGPGERNDWPSCCAVLGPCIFGLCPCRPIGSGTFGHLYCRQVTNGSSDCDVLVTFQFPPVNSVEGERGVGTIKSLRKQSDPLFFEAMDFVSYGMSVRQIEESSSRMDMESIMLVVSMTLSCVFTALQLRHVNKHPEALPATSVTMLVVLGLGYVIPLVVNLEDMYTDTRRRYILQLTSAGSLDLNEFMLRATTMLALVLQLRLLQLALSSRRSTDQAGSKQEDSLSSDAERSTLWICLPLYVLGAVVVWIVHMSDGSRASAFSVSAPSGPALADDLAAYAGLILDGFLLPQIVSNALSGSRVRALSPWFYAGGTVIRAAPHVYDVFRKHNYVPSWNWKPTTYVYASPRDDLFGVAWDIAIPCGATLLAALLFLQQRLGGAFLCCLKSRRSGSGEYEMVSTTTISS